MGGGGGRGRGGEGIVFLATTVDEVTFQALVEAQTETGKRALHPYFTKATSTGSSLDLR